MKKLFRVTVFTAIFALAITALSVTLHLLNNPWLSPNMITPTFCGLFAYVISETPRVKRFLHGTAA